MDHFLRRQEQHLLATSAYGRGTASVDCSGGRNERSRTQACWNVILTLTFINNGDPVGVTSADLVQYMPLSTGGTNWTEHDTITSVASSGILALGVHLSRETVEGPLLTIQQGTED